MGPHFRSVSSRAFVAKTFPSSPRRRPPTSPLILLFDRKLICRILTFLQKRPFCSLIAEFHIMQQLDRMSRMERWGLVATRSQPIGTAIVVSSGDGFDATEAGQGIEVTVLCEWLLWAQMYRLTRSRIYRT